MGKCRLDPSFLPLLILSVLCAECPAWPEDQGHGPRTHGWPTALAQSSRDASLRALYLSARARASGSVGGIMKQMAGAVSLWPALSVRSQLSP